MAVRPFTLPFDPEEGQASYQPKVSGRDMTFLSLLFPAGPSGVSMAVAVGPFTLTLTQKRIRHLISPRWLEEI